MSKKQYERQIPQKLEDAFAAIRKENEAKERARNPPQESTQEPQERPIEQYSVQPQNRRPDCRKENHNTDYGFKVRILYFEEDPAVLIICYANPKEIYSLLIKPRHGEIIFKLKEAGPLGQVTRVSKFMYLYDATKWLEADGAIQLKGIEGIVRKTQADIEKHIGINPGRLRID